MTEEEWIERLRAFDRCREAHARTLDEFRARVEAARRTLRGVMREMEAERAGLAWHVGHKPRLRRSWIARAPRPGSRKHARTAGAGMRELDRRRRALERLGDRAGPFCPARDRGGRQGRSTGEVDRGGRQGGRQGRSTGEVDRGGRQGRSTGEVDRGGRQGRSTGRSTGEVDRGGRQGRSTGEVDRGGRQGRSTGEVDRGGRQGGRQGRSTGEVDRLVDLHERIREAPLLADSAGLAGLAR